MVCGWLGLYGLHRGGRTFGGLGLKDHPDGSSVINFLGFIHWRGNGISKVYFWRRFQVFRLWGREEVQHHRFRRPWNNWGVIRERVLSDRGASDQEITENLWESRSEIRNEWEVFVICLSIRMLWNYVDFGRKYTRKTQEGQKHFWIGPRIVWPGPHIGWPIFSTLICCWWNKTS